MIYFHGDIHGQSEMLVHSLKRWGVGPGDTVVLLGDVGLNFYGPKGRDRRNKAALEKTGIDYLCIHGNHEMRPGTLPSYHAEAWHGGEVYVEEAFPHLRFAKDGEVFDLENHQAIVLGGAYSVDKFYRLERGIPWFADEQPSDEIKAAAEDRLDSLGWKVDLVLSHTCPAKYIPVECFLPFVDQSTVDRSTENWLDGIENRLDYKQWFCGHWHIDKHIDRLHFLFQTLDGLYQYESED